MHTATLYGNRAFAIRMVEAAPTGSVMTIKRCVQCGEPFERDKRNTWAHWAKAQFCSRVCVGKAKTAKAEAERVDAQTAFNNWFDYGDGCWEWKGALDRDGYGIFSYAGKSRRAARVALELDGRPAKQGEYACHHCDNPKCVRPDHLYPGTPGDNSRDQRNRGRNVRGERVHVAKLTADAVREIRQSSLLDWQLAEQFGVTRSAVTMARNGTTWRHVK